MIADGAQNFPLDSGEAISEDEAYKMFGDYDIFFCIGVDEEEGEVGYLALIGCRQSAYRDPYTGEKSKRGT